MTDHGELSTEPRRAPEQLGSAGRSFADAWGADVLGADVWGADVLGAEPPAADPSAAASADPQAAPFLPTRAGREMSLLAGPSTSESSAGAGQTVSVTVTRPTLGAPSTSGSTPTDVTGRLTVEVRREGGAFPNRPAEQIIVTVSLAHPDEHVTITL